jgi:hypothetical protein
LDQPVFRTLGAGSGRWRACINSRATLRHFTVVVVSGQVISIREHGLVDDLARAKKYPNAFRNGGAKSYQDPFGCANTFQDANAAIQFAKKRSQLVWI